MTSKRYNFIFKDGSEYEVYISRTGWVKIRDDIGNVRFDSGFEISQDILQILDSIKYDLKMVNERYDNPMEKREEVERMELNESEICDAMAKTIVDFIDDNLADWADDEKQNMKRFLMTFCDDLRSNLVDAECKKLDGMVGE